MEIRIIRLFSADIKATRRCDFYVESRLRSEIRKNGGRSLRKKRRGHNPRHVGFRQTSRQPSGELPTGCVYIGASLVMDPRVKPRGF